MQIFNTRQDHDAGFLENKKFYVTDQDGLRHLFASHEVFRVKFSATEIEEICANVIFDQDGKLRTFPTNPISERLTVNEYTEWLSKFGYTPKLCWTTKMWSVADHGCVSADNRTCCD